MSSGLGRVERTLYRSLLRLARSFDKEPVLKALICRNHGPPLPEPVDGLVARFLGSPAMHYYWPPPAGQPAPRVAHAVRDAFREPPERTGLEGAFQGIRYLSGLLAVAQKHRILQEAASAAGSSSEDSRGGQAEQAEQQQGQQQGQQGWQQQAGCAAGPAAATAQAAAADEPGSSGRDAGVPGAARLAGAPVRGSLLVAHPCLAGNIFARSVVLVCRHDAAGSYGLILNKPLGSSLQHLHERLRQLQGGGGAAGTTAGAAAGAAGGLLSGGTLGGTWEAAGGGGAAEGGDLEAASGDVPAEQLQQMVDYLAWKGELRGAAAAAAAAAPEYDEYGNWIEQPYTEVDEDELGAFEDDSEEEGSEEEDSSPASLPLFFMGGAGSRARGRGAAGVGVGLAPAPAGRAGTAEGAEEPASEGEGEGDAEEGRAPPDMALLMHELGMAVLNSKGGAPSEEWGVGPEEDARGVSAMLRELLRRAGGGSVIMLDADGNVWSHHLAPSASDGFQLEGSDTYADDEPESVAALVQQCLSQEDRRQLAQLEKTALEQQLAGARNGVQPAAGAAAAEAAAGAEAAAAAGAAAGDAAGGASAGHGGAGKAQELRQRVDRLLSAQQAQQGRQQPELAGAGLASSLFGTVGLFGNGKGSGSGAAAAGAVGGSDGKGGPTVGELMTLFKESPLFRGGPVPGVQVLHQRPRLGGQLALTPWGPRPEDAPGEAQAQAAGAAEEDAAAEELQGWSGCLEGGLFVGADLSTAQELVEEGYLSPSDVRVCMGDSGWSPGQLEAEVARGTWAVVDAAPAFLDLFNPAATKAPSQAGSRAVGGSDALAAAATAEAVLGYEGEMWSRCLRSLGPEFAALARVPKAVWEDLAEMEV